MRCRTPAEKSVSRALPGTWRLARAAPNKSGRLQRGHAAQKTGKRCHRAQRVNRLSASTYRKKGSQSAIAGDHADCVKVLTNGLFVSDFDPVAELQRVHEIKKMGRRRPYARGRSQLDPFAAELLALHASGARPADLRDWLKLPPRRIRVAHSTVTRWLQRTLDQRIAERERHK